VVTGGSAELAHWGDTGTRAGRHRVRQPRRFGSIGRVPLLPRPLMQALDASIPSGLPTFAHPPGAPTLAVALLEAVVTELEGARDEPGSEVIDGILTNLHTIYELARRIQAAAADLREVGQQGFPWASREAIVWTPSASSCATSRKEAYAHVVQCLQKYIKLRESVRCASRWHNIDLAPDDVKDWTSCLPCLGLPADAKLRPGQAEILHVILKLGCDALLTMPTGGGKSLPIELVGVMPMAIAFKRLVLVLVPHREVATMWAKRFKKARQDDAAAQRYVGESVDKEHDQCPLGQRLPPKLSDADNKL